MSTAQIYRLQARGQTVAAQARHKPWTARAARNWLNLAARYAERAGLPELARRFTALERGILDV